MKLGCDPEFFLFDSQKKTFVSADSLVPGTKEEPYPLKYGAVQVDGVAVEFNINPASSGEEFRHNIEKTLAEIRKMIPNRYEFKFKSCVEFPKEVWKDIPETAKELGCSPDYNASKPLIVPNPPVSQYYANLSKRTAAGHLHIGWTQNKNKFDPAHYWDCRQLTLELYKFFNPVQGMFDTSFYMRTSMYGNGPVFRPKEYGVEYRQLSNGWLKYPKVWSWLYDLISRLFSDLKENQSRLSKFLDEYRYKYTHEEAYSDFARKYSFPQMPLNWRT